ncbi:MAG: P22 phage major capsid protein family protein [Bryobacteraceae bacterium]
MANNFANTNWVCMQILRLLLNKLEVSEYFDRNFEKEFEKEFAPGATVNVKFPQNFLVSDAMGYAPQGLNRLTTTISLDQWLQLAFEWDDYEAAVKLERSKEELMENYLEPAAAAIAQEWDSRAANWARMNASQVAGVLGTDPTSVSTFYTARRYLKEQSCPPGKRGMMISSSMMSTLGSNITAIFNPKDEISKMWKEGYIGDLAGFQFFESNSLWSHTAGTWAGTTGYPIVSGASQSGTSLVITANAGDTFNQGDKFSILNVNRVNPKTRRYSGPVAVRTFTLTQALTAAGGAGADTINFLPAIYGPGSQYQNVDALPVSGAALTLWPGTTSPNGKSGTVGLALSRFAFAMVGAKLYLPKKVEDSGEATDPETKMSVRTVHFWDPIRSVEGTRMDSLGGFGNLYQDNGAVAVVGA